MHFAVVYIEDRLIVVTDAAKEIGCDDTCANDRKIDIFLLLLEETYKIKTEQLAPRTFYRTDLFLFPSFSSLYVILMLDFKHIYFVLF